MAAGPGRRLRRRMLSVAAFLEGRYAQAFPSFGSERMGAPVMAFCRIDDKEIRLREPVLEPDALIIQDATLLHQVDLQWLACTRVHPAQLDEELRRTGPRWIRAAFSNIGCARSGHRARAEARRPFGAERGAPRRFAAITGVIALKSCGRNPREIPAAIAEKNVAAATEAFDIATKAGRRSMLKQPEGSRAVAEAVALCRPQVICAYPITPRPTSSRAGRNREGGESANCEFINVESEFAALSLAIGASAAGARTYTRNQQPRVCCSWRKPSTTPGLGLPIVMTIGNRAIGAPINIWNDHSDSMSMRDAGGSSFTRSPTRKLWTCTSRHSV